MPPDLFNEHPQLHSIKARREQQSESSVTLPGRAVDVIRSIFSALYPSLSVALYTVTCKLPDRISSSASFWRPFSLFLRRKEQTTPVRSISRKIDIDR